MTDLLVVAGEASGDRAAALAPGASLLAEAWGPVWRLATQAGLTPYGPLILPGPWTFE